MKRLCAINGSRPGKNQKSRFWSLVEKRFPATAEKLYSCPICRDEFRGIGSIASHIKDHFT
jgi:hypothetical protein